MRDREISGALAQITISIDQKTMASTERWLELESLPLVYTGAAPQLPSKLVIKTTNAILNVSLDISLPRSPFMYHPINGPPSGLEKSIMCTLIQHYHEG